jgi:diguanylate cyclase (GGDEF)-like protein
MLLDLDNFKSINDRFGHAIGDRVPEIFAEVGGGGCLRRIDLFSRLGGEESPPSCSTPRASGAGGG